MTELDFNPLELHLAAHEKEVRQKMEKIEEFTEMNFLPGFEEQVGIFPILEELPGQPVLARFSYGIDAPNMSSAFFDSSLTKEEGKEQGERNTKEFLVTQGFSDTVIQALGKFEGNEPQIEEVDRYTLPNKSKVVGNLVFTRDPEVTLIIKPADCPVGVIYATDSEGRPLVAIDHSGADAANVGITRQAVWYLENILGVDLNDAYMGIFPGVSEDNYFISRERRVNGEVKKRPSGLPDMNWREFISEPKTLDPEEKRHVNILSAMEMQAIQAGFKPENIQAYRIDTYEEARRGRAFSRRYSLEHNNEHNGGQIVAVKLTPPTV